MAVAVLGMRGSGSFTSAERPQNWRQMILYQFPNGDAPLTALLSRLRSEPTNDSTFNWWEKPLPLQRAQILGVSETLSGAPANSTTVASAHTANIAITLLPDGATGSTSDVSIVKAGHTLYNQVGDELYLVLKVDRVNNFIVCQRQIGGSPASTAAVTGGSGSPVTGGDTVLISGSAFPEGANVGSAIAYVPAKYSNNCQIFRTPAYFTRTARKTRLRWDPTGPYWDGIREALRLHSIEMEKAFFYGEASIQTALANPDAPLDTTTSGAPARTTRGILRWLPAATTTSVSIHTDLGSFSNGVLTETTFDAFCEEAFRIGAREKVFFCGSTALNVLTQMAKNKSTIERVPTDQTYGMAMTRYLTPFGEAYLVNHPLMSNDPVWRKDIYVVDVDKLGFRFVSDTDLLKNRQNPGQDASIDEFLTEAGLEEHFSGHAPDSDSPTSIPTPPAHGRLKGIASYGG